MGSVEVATLTKCIEALDELWTVDPDACVTVFGFLSDRQARKQHERLQKLEKRSKELSAEISLYTKIKTAEVLKCIKQNEQGEFYVDWEMFQAKLAEKTTEPA